MKRPAVPTPPPPAQGDSLDAALAAERDALKALFPLPPPRTPRSAVRQAARRAGQSLAAVLLLAGGLVWIDPVYRSEHYASAVGERLEVELADSSRLTLDTATRVDVAWHLFSRRIALRQGRAQFAVDTAVYRPFEVTAGDTRVRVLGTVFDVRRQGEAAAVAVYRGRVRVTRAGQEFVLAAGEQLPAGSAGVLADPRPLDAATAAWKDGKLVFERTPLAAALGEIQRYRHGRIRVHGQELAALQVSGVFEAARSDQLLDLLPAILPVSVSRQADGSVDVRSR